MSEKRTAREVLNEIHRRNLRLAQAGTLEKEPREWIQILPLGKWMREPFYGGPPDITAEKCDQMVANFNRYRTKPFIDREHCMFFGDSEALAWIEELQTREDGLWGRVSWIEEGAELVRSGKYRYVSAAWNDEHQDNKTGEMVGARLFAVTLTNTPYYDLDLEQVIVARRTDMDSLKKMAAAAGLPETATEDQVTAKIAELNQQMATHATAVQAAEQNAILLKQIRDELKVASTATAEEHVAAIRARGEQASELAQKVAVLEQQAVKAAAEKLVDEAQQAGKITAATRAWALETAQRDPEGFKLIAAGMPILVPPKKPVRPTGGTADEAVPNEYELNCARLTGVDAKLIAAQRMKAEEAALR